MRRRAPLGPAAPERLCRFMPDEWPGDLAEAFAGWKTARRAYSARLPAYTDNPLGSSLDRIRAELHARRRWRVPVHHDR
ncbi:hypothetical protein FRAHR75_620007 [Frankia sp. Hr75.2]|nr:hypothetical protein FRAHR75_620007 [Frankia sp. Hr75.2]